MLMYLWMYGSSYSCNVTIWLHVHTFTLMCACIESIPNMILPSKAFLSTKKTGIDKVSLIATSGIILQRKHRVSLTKNIKQSADDAVHCMEQEVNNRPLLRKHFTFWGCGIDFGADIILNSTNETFELDPCWPADAILARWVTIVKANERTPICLAKSTVWVGRMVIK